MSNRDAILDRLRAAEAAMEVPSSDFSVLDRRTWKSEERLARFTQMIGSVNGEVLETTRAEWPAAMAKVLKEAGIQTLAFGPAGKQAEGVRKAMNEAGATGLPFDKAVEEIKDDLFDADAGFTTTVGGIADSGTLVLWPDRAEPRTLSLVPKVHVALLDATKLHDTLHEMMRAQAWAGRMPTNLVLVSGPSKTADIEQTLIYGVHGPKRLVVLAVTDGLE